MTSIELGESIPRDTAHAVSVSLPTWSANVGYEEAEESVMSRLTTGYPRFNIHRIIEAFAADITSRHPRMRDTKALLFPSREASDRCAEFILRRDPDVGTIERIHLVLDPYQDIPSGLRDLFPIISAVICTARAYPTGRQYWQHTGEGCSSRRAEFCHALFRKGLLIPQTARIPGTYAKAPRRYLRAGPAVPSPPAAPSPSGVPNSSAPAPSSAATPAPAPGQSVNPDGTEECSGFVEERYGRNLDLSLVTRARSAVKRRIAGAVAVDIDGQAGAGSPSAGMNPNARRLPALGEDDVYLFPCGMNAIYAAHRALLEYRSDRKSIMFGFPYVDTLKLLEKFGPGCEFFGHGSEQDLETLESRLGAGERFLALFCEFPGNPLLACPDLERIRSLADRYDFAVVVDETIGTIANVNVIKYADIVVSSLTKIFSGDCNVMGGAAILNPGGSRYSDLKQIMDEICEEDNYWAEDVLFMERNSRDYQSRVGRTNSNAEAICAVLMASPAVKAVYYPKHSPTRRHYDACRLRSGGYGGLLSVTFHAKDQAVAFFDSVQTAKGPSLGTNFTLTSPYVLVAHYQELDWASSFGVDPNLIRISVGLEREDDLVSRFRAALAEAERIVGPGRDQAGPETRLPAALAGAVG